MINPDNIKFNEFRKYVDLNLESYPTFHQLAMYLKLKEQKDDIFKYYKYIHDVNQSSLVELARIKEPEEHKRLPSRIYIPIEFYLSIVN